FGAGGRSGAQGAQAGKPGGLRRNRAPAIAGSDVCGIAGLARRSPERRPADGGRSAYPCASTTGNRECHVNLATPGRPMKRRSGTAPGGGRDKKKNVEP